MEGEGREKIKSNYALTNNNVMCFNGYYTWR